MPKAIRNRRERMSRNEMIAAGLKKYCAKSLILNDGQTVKAADAIKLFEEASAAEKKATASRAQYLLDVQAARTVEVKAKALVGPVKSLVSGSFGKKSTIMAEFGFGPQASAPSVETRFEAVEKLRATRIARGTMGSRQKASIHGHVESAAAASADTQTPAPVGTNGINGTSH